MKHLFRNNWFTLIEVIVSVTILSIVMVSVMIIFVNSTQLWLKIDINRALQENVKNVIETMSEDIRKNGVNICSGVPWIGSDCHVYQTAGQNFIKSDTLYTQNRSYYLAKKTLSWDWIKVSSSADCSTINTFCSVTMKGWYPLTNSSVAVRDLQFYITSEDLSKVMVRIALAPAAKKWVKTSLIESNIMYIETTLSERIIKSQ
jgi:type II secretory pathway pseudopilin PulG